MKPIIPITILLFFIAGIIAVSYENIPIVQEVHERAVENATTTEARMRCNEAVRAVGYETVASFDARTGDCYYARLQKI